MISSGSPTAPGCGGGYRPLSHTPDQNERRARTSERARGAGKGHHELRLRRGLEPFGQRAAQDRVRLRVQAATVDREYAAPARALRLAECVFELPPRVARSEAVQIDLALRRRLAAPELREDRARDVLGAPCDLLSRPLHSEASRLARGSARRRGLRRLRRRPQPVATLERTYASQGVREGLPGLRARYRSRSGCRPSLGFASLRVGRLASASLPPVSGSCGRRRLIRLRSASASALRVGPPCGSARSASGASQRCAVPAAQAHATRGHAAAEHVQAQPQMGEAVLDDAERARLGDAQADPLARACARSRRRRARPRATSPPGSSHRPPSSPVLGTPHGERATAPQHQPRHRLDLAPRGAARLARQRLRVAGAPARRSRAPAGTPRSAARAACTRWRRAPSAPG